MIALLQKIFRAAHTDTTSTAHIGHDKVYIFPSAYGLLFASALILMMIGALNYDSNLGLLFTFLFASTGTIAILQTWRNLIDIQVRIHQATPCFAGQKACFPVQLSEHSHRERPAIRLRIGSLEPITLHLKASGNITSQLHLPMLNRGEHRLGRVMLYTLYPFGFLRAWAYIESDARVLVYPQPAAAMLLHCSTQYVKSDSGDRGMGADDFVGLRPYRSGDSPRHLDWKAYARECGLVIRQFGGDRADHIWLDWNQWPGLDTEIRLSRLCRMVLDATQLDLHYGLKLPDLQIQPSAGDIHKHKCLTALARFGRVGQ